MMEYEFSEAQNRVFLDLSRRMQGVALFLLLAALAAAFVGGLALVDGEIGYAMVSTVLALFFGVTGAWTFRSERSFRRVASTRGHDIEHVMAALEELNKFYRLKFWLVVLCLAFVLMSILDVPSAAG